jgi:hypothetical protein
MDTELEKQIDELICKSNKDLKTRIMRLVTRHQNKLLKEQARELKKSSTSRKLETKNSSRDSRETRNSRDSRDSRETRNSRETRISRKDTPVYSDSESDYYSE